MGAWIDWLILIVVFLIMGARIFLRKKAEEEEGGELAADDIIFADEDVMKQILYPETQKKKKQNPAKLKPKTIAHRREPAHTDKRKALTTNIENRHLTSEVEARDDEIVLSNHFKSTSEHDIVSNQFQKESEKQMTSKRFSGSKKDKSYALEKEIVLTKLEKLITKATSPRDMILFHEILSKPKSERD